uniref:Uncharacterized protein n=1 Tax=Strongyloides venezuelensis TaxID=75913 RepID=A0A0K0FSE7_STRVS
MEFKNTHLYSFFLKLLIINCKFKMERYLKINCKKYIRSSGNDGNGNGHVGCGFFQELLVERLVFFFFLLSCSYWLMGIDVIKYTDKGRLLRMIKFELLPKYYCYQCGISLFSTGVHFF